MARIKVFAEKLLYLDPETYKVRTGYGFDKAKMY